MSELPQLQPHDVHNQALEANVRPTDWTNPQPPGRYNLVVVGAGTAGLVTAAGAAGLGARVALIERELLGGDCLNVGCVPSKALLSAAHRAAAVRRAGEYGVVLPGEPSVDFGAVMERMRKLRSSISPHDSAARFRELGVDVFLGKGVFQGPDTIEVGDATLRFKKAVIATGARAAAPPIPGLNEVDYLTNETVFSLTELPQRIGVIGAGPIGCELSQAFARFGAKVCLVEATQGVLPREDPEAAKLVEAALLRDGVELLCCGRELQLVPESAGKVRLQVTAGERHYDVVVDRLLVAVGRAPNVEGLNLEQAQVAYDARTGVDVTDRLQTSNPRIYAAGDVCSRWKFTHAADFMARIVIQNALFFGRARASRLMIPWCTYTEPEVAHVGLSEHEAQQQALPIDTYRVSFDSVDRAILEGETEGFVKVHTRRGSDRIVGATVVATNAGDMIGELSLAITHKLGLKQIGSAIHPYPTQAEAIRKTGDLFSRTRLTPKVAWLFRKWLAWSR